MLLIHLAIISGVTFSKILKSYLILAPVHHGNLKTHSILFNYSQSTFESEKEIHGLIQNH
jgi:hypothetical protein